MIIIYLSVFYRIQHFRILLWWQLNWDIFIRPIICNLKKKELHELDIDKTSALKPKKKKKEKKQLAYCSFSWFKWKTHSNVLQDKLSHFISWGRKTIAQGPVKPSTTDITACLLEDKSAKEITALPVSNNTVTFGVKEVSCEHEDWVIQTNKELHFCLTNWQIWQDLQFCFYSSGISTNASSKKILPQGCWSIQSAD